MTVIDTATNTVTATIALPGKPEFPVSDGRGSVYDNIEVPMRSFAWTPQQSSYRNLEAERLRLAVWPCDRSAAPKLFAVCDNKKMAVVDADSGRQIASPDIGERPDAARFSAKRQLAFSSNGEGTLTVIDTADNYKVIESLPTAPGARTMAYDDKDDRAYVVTAQFAPSPEPTAQLPHPRPSVLPDTFQVIVVAHD